MSARASKPRQTIAELRELHRLAFAAIRMPLGPGNSTQRLFVDGRPMRHVAASFIKPNDRLTSFERISLYNRQYWFRLMDCLWDEYPGLRAILGVRKFERLRVAYLDKYPSRSFTLRNLGSRLVQFVEESPELTAPHTDMCLDMARFEWAQVLAFDEALRPPLDVDDLLGKDPSNLRPALQPYLVLLNLDYPLDDFVIALKKRDAALRTAASNAVEAERKTPKPRPMRRPVKEKVFLAVHRLDNELYYKRLAPAEYAILSALRDGQTLASACEQAIESDPLGQADWAAAIQRWFGDWARMGWFCKREGTRKNVP